jgi:hypothetical protein
MRWRSALLTASSALLLAGCGGGNDNTFTTQRTTTAERRAGPPIASAVALKLADRSDDIARRLDAGDGCGAAADALRLRNDLTAEINRQAIPAAYLEDLSGAVNELQAQIVCEPPPRREDDDHRGRGKHKDDRKKKDDH